MKILNYLFLIIFSLSFSFEAFSETRKMEYRCEKVPETGARGFYRFFDIKLTSNGFYGEAKYFSKRRNKNFIQTFTGETAFSGHFEINSRILSENRKPVTKNRFVRFDKSSQQNINLIKYLNKGVRGTQGPRFCTLRLLPNKQIKINQKVVQKENNQKELAAKKAEEERKQKALAAKKAEEEIKQKELAAKKAEEERKQKALAAKKAEEERKQKALAAKKAEEERKAKELAAKKAEEERKAKALAAKKAEEERKAKELAAKKAEEERKAKEFAAKKAKEERKAKALAAQKAEQERKRKDLAAKEVKYKNISKIFIEDLKAFVKKPNNLDILEVGKLLANYNSYKNSSWDLEKVKAFDDVFKYVINDKKFKRFYDKNNRERNKAILKAKNGIVLYLNNSLATIKSYIGLNLGTDAANNAIVIAEEINKSLKKFDEKSSITLIEEINQWKTLNNVNDGYKLTNEAVELVINIKAKIRQEEQKQQELTAKKKEEQKQQELAAKKKEEQKQQELAAKKKEELKQQELLAKKRKKFVKQNLKENDIYIQNIYSCNSNRSIDLAYQLASSIWIYVDDKNFEDMFKRINKSYNGIAKCHFDRGKPQFLKTEVKKYTTQNGTNIYVDKLAKYNAIYVAKQIEMSASKPSNNLKRAGQCLALGENLKLYYKHFIKNNSLYNKYDVHNLVLGKVLQKKYSRNVKEIINHQEQFSMQLLNTWKTKIVPNGKTLSWPNSLKKLYNQNGCTLFKKIP